MARVNKAHSATLNRIVRRYKGKTGFENDVDVQTVFARIEVETEATVVRGVRRLQKLGGPAYIAITNREAIPTALRAVHGTPIGLMDPQGNIVVPSAVKPIAKTRARAKPVARSA